MKITSRKNGTTVGSVFVSLRIMSRLVGEEFDEADERTNKTARLIDSYEWPTKKKYSPRKMSARKAKG